MFPSKGSRMDYIAEINRLFPKTYENDPQRANIFNSKSTQSLNHSTFANRSPSSDSTAPEWYPDISAAFQTTSDLYNLRSETPPQSLHPLGIQPQRPIVGRKFFNNTEYSRPLPNRSNDEFLNSNSWNDDFALPKSNLFEKNQIPKYELFPTDKHTPTANLSPLASVSPAKSDFSIFSPIESNLTTSNFSPNKSNLSTTNFSPIESSLTTSNLSPNQSYFSTSNFSPNKSNLSTLNFSPIESNLTTSNLSPNQSNFSTSNFSPNKSNLSTSNYTPTESNFLTSTFSHNKSYPFSPIQSNLSTATFSPDKSNFPTSTFSPNKSYPFSPNKSNLSTATFSPDKSTFTTANFSPYESNISTSNFSLSLNMMDFTPSSPMLISNYTPSITPKLSNFTPPGYSGAGTSNHDEISAQKMCKFCRRNGETPLVYMTHCVKEKVGRKHIVTCPILRAHVCSACGETGDHAHTITYCPLLRSSNNGKRLESTTITLKNTRVKSNGKRRY